MAYKLIYSLLIIVYFVSCSKYDTNKVETYYSNGKIKSVTKHDKTKDLFKITEFDSLGNKTREYYKKDNLVQGILKVYHPNKELGMKVPYNNGMITGKEEKFYDNGQLSEIAYYKNGVRDNERLIYDRKGRLVEYAVYKVGYYKPNVTIYHEQYDTNGIVENVQIRPIIENILDTMELNQLDTFFVNITKKANANFNYYFAYQVKKYNGEDISSIPLDINGNRSNLSPIKSNEMNSYVIGFTEKGEYIFSSSCFIGDKPIPIKDWQLSMDYHKIITVR